MKIILLLFLLVFISMNIYSSTYIPPDNPEVTYDCSDCFCQNCSVTGISFMPPYWCGAADICYGQDTQGGQNTSTVIEEYYGLEDDVVEMSSDLIYLIKQSMGGGYQGPTNSETETDNYGFAANLNWGYLRNYVDGSDIGGGTDGGTDNDSGGSTGGSTGGGNNQYDGYIPGTGSTSGSGGGVVTSKGGTGILEVITNSFDTLIEFTTSGIYELAVSFVAYIIEVITIWFIEFKTMMLLFAWNVAEKVIENMNIGQLISEAWSEFEAGWLSMIVLTKIPDALNLIMTAFLTKFVYKIIKI